MINALTVCLALSLSLPVLASSHREAPQISHNPKVDGIDLYAFRSYETGREDFITILANYNPLQDPSSGPNYFTLDENALYDIKIDNDGDSKEDISFRFRFNNSLANDGKGQTLTIGDKEVAIALANIDSFSSNDETNRSRSSSYSIEHIRKKRAYQYGTIENKLNPGKAIKASDGSKTFTMPEDNIGSKSISDYASYAASFIHDITIPKCDIQGRVFVGQRQEGFQAALGKFYDLINLDLTGASNSSSSDFANKNITSIALELPIACLIKSEDQPIIGVWTTASLPARQILRNNPSFAKAIFGSKKGFVQVSRLAHPLVNSLLIGTIDKDSFNASQPKTDSRQFLTYFTNPTLPSIIETQTSHTAPTQFPREDLIEIFLTGINGLNQVSSAKSAEILRLNTSTAITASGAQNRLGVLGDDNAGYPNGRRPGDDVVDIFLRLIMGARLDSSVAASGNTEFNDGVLVDETQFTTSFPYLLDPVAGS